MNLAEFIAKRLDDTDLGYVMTEVVHRLLMIHNTGAVLYGDPEDPDPSCHGCGLKSDGDYAFDVDDCPTLYAIAEFLWHWHPEFARFKK